MRVRLSRKNVRYVDAFFFRLILSALGNNVSECVPANQKVNDAEIAIEENGFLRLTKCFRYFWFVVVVVVVFVE